MVNKQFEIIYNMQLNVVYVLNQLQISSQYGVTFKADQLITVNIEKEVIDQSKNYKNIVSEFIKNGLTETIFLDIVNSIHDAGLILGKVETLQFLYEQFSIKIIKRTHNNHAKSNLLYQLYLDTIYFLHKVRVFKFIKDTIHKFEIESLIHPADRLN
eukprot:419899_1